MGTILRKGEVPGDSNWAEVLSVPCRSPPGRGSGSPEGGIAELHGE